MGIRLRWLCLFVLAMFLCGCAAPLETPGFTAAADAPAPTRERAPELTPCPAPPHTTAPVWEDAEGNTPPPIHPALVPLLHQGDPPFEEYRQHEPVTRELDVELTPNDQPPFARDDMIAGALHFGITQEEALDALGLPDAVYCYFSEATADFYLELRYASGNRLVFETLTGDAFHLSEAEIVTDLPGPRGLGIGDSMKSVLDAFCIRLPDDADYTEEPGSITLYAEYILEGRALAPYGILYYDAHYGYGWKDADPSRRMLTYAAPAEPYTLEQLRSGEKEYPFLARDFCSFTLEHDKLIAYRWAMGTGAE